jgi:L-ascorbate metabolism protein UlaG (beta-lactamase superfamily)
VYFAGDTDLFPGMEELRPLDVALLPVAGWGPKLGPGHMDAERAACAAQVLRPRIAVPIHWGTLHPRWKGPGSWFSDPPETFAARVAGLAPDVVVRVLAPGESLELPAT